jgi:hypothetical protein
MKATMLYGPRDVRFEERPVAQGYRAMDERRAIEALLRP